MFWWVLLQPRRKYLGLKRSNDEQHFSTHVFEQTAKQKKLNEFVNIDGLSGLVALKPVGKTYFAPSHTLRFSCSIVQCIWPVANHGAVLPLGRAARALQQGMIRKSVDFFVMELVGKW